MKSTSSYIPGKWTSGDDSALFIETPRGMWKGFAHKNDSTWSVRGPDPDDPLHYASGEVFTADADVERGDAGGRFAAAKKRARAYIMEQLASQRSAQQAESFKNFGWKRLRSGWTSPDRRFSILPHGKGFYVLDLDTYNEEIVQTPEQARATVLRLGSHGRR